jgi:hypothetical protein
MTPTNTPTDTPTPTPTNTPTATPTPEPTQTVVPFETPSPIPTITPRCPIKTGIDIGIAKSKVSPGTPLNISVCIGGIDENQPVEAYFLIQDPRGKIFSLTGLGKGKVKQGLSPLFSGESSRIECNCRKLLSHVVCNSAMRGNWRLTAAILPTGASKSKGNALALAEQEITIENAGFFETQE